MLFLTARKISSELKEFLISAEERMRMEMKLPMLPRPPIKTYNHINQSGAAQVVKLHTY